MRQILWTEGIPGERETVEALETDPEGLRARVVFGAIDEAAERRDDRIHRQTVQRARHRFEQSLFDAATRFQSSEINFYLPSEAVVFHDLLNLFKRPDRKSCPPDLQPGLRLSASKACDPERYRAVAEIRRAVAEAYRAVAEV